MALFENLAEQFASKGCELLTTKIEYEALRKLSKIPKVKFIASCGHENEVFTNVFIHRNTGVVCKNCTNKRVVDSRSVKPDNYVVENTGYCMLENVIGEFFEMRKTHEGCLADCVIRPKTSEEDAWLGIQLKVCSKVSFNMCAFHIINKYTNYIIICISLELRKFWVIDGNLDLPRKLNITQTYSKYDKHLVPEGTLVEHMNTLYNTYHKYSFDDMNVPLSERKQKEIEFRMFREANIPLTFVYPELENRVYDFMVEGFKVQEKVGSRQKGKQGVSFTLNKRNGKKSQNYTKGDNDFYWLHCPDKQTFYVIPESVLIDKGLVSLEANSKTKGFYICPGVADRKNSWTEQYRFDYSVVQLSELLDLLRTPQS